LECVQAAEPGCPLHRKGQYHDEVKSFSSETSLTAVFTLSLFPAGPMCHETVTETSFFCTHFAALTFSQTLLGDKPVSDPRTVSR
jgi:hypothetical protein